MNKSLKHIIFAHIVLLGLITKISCELVFAFDDIQLTEQFDTEENEKGENEKEELEEKINVNINSFYKSKNINPYLSGCCSRINNHKISKGHTFIFIPPPKLS